MYFPICKPTAIPVMEYTIDPYSVEYLETGMLIPYNDN